MNASPQMLAPSLHTSLVARLLQDLARILRGPVLQPIPVIKHPTRVPRALHHALFVLICAVVPSFGVHTSAQAQAIRLIDQTALTADILQTDDESVIVRVPRDRIVTIDGQPLPPALIAGNPAPAFTAHDTTGQLWTVGAKQHKPTLLHFWVHWCPHCRSDQSQIQALFDTFHDNAVMQLVTVNMDQERDKINEFMKEQHITYPVIIAQDVAATPNGVNIPELYQVRGFPVTYLIDAQGIIRKKITGSFVESKQDLAAAIQELLPKPPSSASELPAGTMQLAQATQTSCGCGCGMTGTCCLGNAGSCLGEN